MPDSPPRNRLLLAAVLAAALALGLAACSLFNPSRGLKACRYDFLAFAFASVDGSSTYWTVDMGVKNPNSRPVTLQKMRFALLRGRDTLVSAWNPERRELAAGDSAILQTTLQLPHAILQRLPPSLLAETRAEFTLIGEAYLQTWVGEVRVPGALNQTLHVNMPEQVAKVRNIFMRNLFKGFGRPRSESPAAPTDPAVPDGPPRPAGPAVSPKDEPL